jgi:hypothetical protein
MQGQAGAPPVAVRSPARRGRSGSGGRTGARAFLSSNPGGVPRGRSPLGPPIPLGEILAIVLRPYLMIIRRILSLGHGVESLRALHTANPATVASCPIPAAAAERDCLGPDKPVSRGS